MHKITVKFGRKFLFLENENDVIVDNGMAEYKHTQVHVDFLWS